MNTLAAQFFAATRSLAVARFLALAVLSSICAPSWAEDCRFSSDRAANFTGTIKKVVISSGAGALKVSGVAAGVNAKGRACASSEALLGKIALESRREGEIVYLSVIISEGFTSIFSLKRYTSLDLEITVPKSAQLSVTDTSGDIELSDVGPTTVVNESGDLLLKNVNGDLDVTDDSGELRIISVLGSVRVEDGAGGIDIEDARGNVKITSDGSGDISIAKVTGSVDVDEDGSGDITVREVGGDVTIGRDGSGDITVSQAGGKFSVYSDSSGEILHDRVRGSVRIPAKY